MNTQNDALYTRKVLMDDDCEICEQRIPAWARRHALCIQLPEDWQITIMCHVCWYTMQHYTHVRETKARAAAAASVAAGSDEPCPVCKLTDCTIPY